MCACGYCSATTTKQQRATSGACNCTACESCHFSIHSWTDPSIIIFVLPIAIYFLLSYIVWHCHFFRTTFFFFLLCEFSLIVILFLIFIIFSNSGIFIIDSCL